MSLASDLKAVEFFTSVRKDMVVNIEGSPG